jgi:hypothetical protein
LSALKTVALSEFDDHDWNRTKRDKQGSNASGKWRNLAGLLPGGGPKGRPPPDPLRPSHFRVVAFLTATGMFIFTTSFPVTPTRNHNHPQLGYITPTDGRVKGVS